MEQQSALSYVPFTDPQMGTFTVDVPRGWQVRGGLHRPCLGDRRTFVEMQSPDGVTVLYGDPECPQSFCHLPFQFEGVHVPSFTGCAFMNLPPSGKRLAEHYLAQVAPRRFGRVRVLGERVRHDLLDAARAKARQMGVSIPSTFQMTAHEIRFEAGGRVGAVLGVSFCDSQWSVGFGTPWEGNVTVWLAPPERSTVGDEVIARMIETFRATPRMAQVVQQDEWTITANGNAANAAQCQWFDGQQSAYHAQQSAGDAYVASYWQQQQTHDLSMRAWDQTWSASDRLSQDRSDAMLGQQRLYDDARGQRYDAPAGATSYWLDTRSGQVVGSNTSEVPDYGHDYAPLRKP